MIGNRESYKDKIRQYGYFGILGRIKKNIFRKIGIINEDEILLYRKLEDKLNLGKPQINGHCRLVNFDDFISHSSFLNLDKRALEKIRRRFNENNYFSLGFFYKEELIYYTWCSLKIFEPLKYSKKITLRKGEGLLLDSYCHPDFRSVGIHSYMAGARINHLIDIGITRALVLIVIGNRPAFKAMEKTGFLPYKVIKYRRFWNNEEIIIKKI